MSEPAPAPPAPPVRPRATCRLQFNEGFRLRDAIAIVPYLSDVGFSHLYASPLLRACPHSTHGYDACDFSQINPELGTEEDLGELVAALRARGMGLVLDIVPNHMGVGGRENHWWWDVLTYGPGSKFAPYFDINWKSPDRRLNGKLLVPILGDHYDRVLERRELQFRWENGEYTLRYFTHVLPLNPRSFNPADMDLPKINGDPAALDDLIQKQYYRLTFYKYGDSELNYRRFFNISTMAGLRIEDERVFKDVHERIFDWVRRGWVDGLRVDHIDGLRDPDEYLLRLQAAAPQAWRIVEKILQPGETLPEGWPIAGTTGYDFLNRAGGLLVDPKAEQSLTAFYGEFTGSSTDFTALEREKKRVVLRANLAAEVNRLADFLFHISAGHWRYRDFSREEFYQATAELVTCFPVYRTYVRPEAGTVRESDAAFIEEAAAEAHRQRPELPPELFTFLTEILLLRLRGEDENEFAARFQQLTGPEMAKGVEDTAFYCFNRFVSLNEVGGNPGCFSVSLETFHQECLERQGHWPDSMLTLSTHDTKRGADVRARLAALSEIPDQFIAAVRRWSIMNERHRRDNWPDRNAEYLYYQTLIGAWPISLERILAYAEKAACEAKQHTRWSKRNPAYEGALRQFITATMGDPNFQRDMEAFVAPLIQTGHINSLSQTLITFTVPGVPDCYQGTELWDQSLVDPDNRRPVDFPLRRQLLDESNNLSVEEVWNRRQTGLPKLWLIRRVLQLRARYPQWFDATSSYQPLPAGGSKASHVIAFRRGQNVLTVAPRLVHELKNDWAETWVELPPGQWRNELTGEDIPSGSALVRELFRRFPVALLTRKED